MSKLEQKLKENRNRRAREKFLAALSRETREVLASVIFSSDISCLKFAAFPTWDNEADCRTSTRGKIPGLKFTNFYKWHDLITEIEKIKIETEYEGWFFIDTDGPFYNLKGSEFSAILNGIFKYAEQNEHFDFGWVGATLDFGIIAEFDHTSFCRNDLELSVWGI